MILRPTLLLLAFSAAPVWAKEAQGLPLPSRHASIQASAPESRVLDRLGAEGFAGAAVVIRDGQVAYAGGVGEARPGAPFTASTIVDPESVAKLTTVMAVLRLREQGRLSLDDPLPRWFPETPPDKAAVTLRQILAHTSGIADAVDGVGDGTPIGRDAMTARLLAAPLDFPPGTREVYSNGGYTLLAAVVEKASGESLFDYLEREVFARAGVEAGYDPMRFPAAWVAWSKMEDGWTDVRRAADMRKGPFWGVWGGGGLFISTLDLAQLIDAFMAGRIVSPESVKLALTPIAGIGPGSQRALGFIVYDSRRGTQYYYHNGWGDHFNADLRYYPEAKMSIAVMSNRRVPNALRAGREIAEALLGPDNDPPPRPQLTGALLSMAAPEAGLAAAMWTAGAGRDRQERIPFIHRFMSRRLLAEKGEEGLMHVLAGTNAQLRRPRVLEVRRMPGGVALLLESFNMQRVRLFVLKLGVVREDGRLKIDTVDLHRTDLP